MVQGNAQVFCISAAHLPGPEGHASTCSAAPLLSYPLWKDGQPVDEPSKQVRVLSLYVDIYFYVFFYLR